MTKLTYTNRVLPLFSLSLVVATVGVFIGYNYIGFISQPLVFIVLVITEFVILFASFIARRAKNVSGVLVFAFAFVSGLVISPLISTYIYSGSGSLVFQAFLLTTVVFGALSYYAYVSGENFSRLGGFLFVSLIGIILASLVNIFLRNTIVFLVVDILSIIIFSGYVLYDTGKILNEYDDNDVYTAVLSLYIDFLNLFINILELLGFLERKN
jgi:FtsH-binding integral membrane protein